MEVKYKKIKITALEQSGYYFGKPCAEHFVFNLTGECDGVVYECTMPLVLQEGHEWEFLNDNERVTRPVTEDDQREMLKRVSSYFPDFGEITLDNDCIVRFLQWLGSGDVYVNGKIDTDYTDKSGVVHHRFKCCKPGVTFDNSWLATLGKSNKQIAKKSATEPTMPPPPTPSGNPNVHKSSLVYTREMAWKAYEENRKNDPKGALYWREVKDITGKDPNDLSQFTSDDWRKCVETFTENF